MTIAALDNLMYYVCLAVVCLPLGIGLRCWGRLSQSNRLIWWLLALLTLLEVVANVLRYQHTRNHFMNYFYMLAVVWLGAGFYRQTQGWRWPLWVAVGLTVLLPLEVGLWVGFNHINSTTLALSRLLVAVCGFRALGLAIDRGRGSLRQSPGFFQHLGFVMFGFVPALLSYFMAYFIETSLDLFFFTDLISMLLTAGSFCLFATGLYRDSRAASASLPAVIRS